MPHVDEGALHAYLDGALEAYPAAEATRIREHLAGCAACLDRLEEERALRAEAQEILSGADPGMGVVPSLEALRARAASGVERSPMVRLRRLGWAASIVVAVGAGWMLRGSQAGRWAPEAYSGATVPQPQAAPAAVEGPPVVRAKVAAEAPAVEADAVGATERLASGATGAAGREAAQEVADSARREAAQEVVADLRTGGIVALQDSLERRLGEAVLAPREAKAAGRANAALPEAPEAVRRASVESESRPGLADRASPPTVPGLPVLGVFTADPRLPPGSVRVLQRLEGDTLELIQLPAGTSGVELVRGDGDERTEVALPRAGGWLVGRARLTREALEAVLARVVGGA
jgi:hypothetical protein